MPAKYDSRQPGLFDPPVEPTAVKAQASPQAAPGAAIGDRPTHRGPEPDDYEVGDWREVPQQRFLSWSRSMQLKYCAARDLHSAEEAEDVDDIEFFLERRKAYLEEMT